jgi:hypothetical protein
VVLPRGHDSHDEATLCGVELGDAVTPYASAEARSAAPRRATREASGRHVTIRRTPEAFRGRGPEKPRDT